MKYEGKIPRPKIDPFFMPSPLFHHFQLMAERPATPYVDRHRGYGLSFARVGVDLEAK